MRGKMVVMLRKRRGPGDDETVVDLLDVVGETYFVYVWCVACLLKVL